MKITLDLDNPKDKELYERLLNIDNKESDIKVAVEELDYTFLNIVAELKIQHNNLKREEPNLIQNETKRKVEFLEKIISTFLKNSKYLRESKKYIQYG